MIKLIVAFLLGVFVGAAGIICFSCIVVGAQAEKEYNETATKSATKTDE